MYGNIEQNKTENKRQKTKQPSKAKLKVQFM